MRVVNEGYELVPIDQLIEHPENPRLGDEDAIDQSMEFNQIYGAATVQRSTNHILVGNHRVKVARERGATHFPVIWADVDDATALTILLADNKTSDASRGNNGPEQLLDVLEQIGELAGSIEGTGYELPDLDELKSICTPPPPPDQDDEPTQETGQTITVRAGELHFTTSKDAFEDWSLKIRKLCGFDNRRVKLEILKRLGIRHDQ